MKLTPDISIFYRFARCLPTLRLRVKLGAMSSLESYLLRNLEVFVAFARNRLGDPHTAEDVVQESLVKALAADRQPKDRPQ